MTIIIVSLIMSTKTGIKVPRSHHETSAISLCRVWVIDVLCDVANTEIMVFVAPVVTNSKSHNMYLIISKIFKEEIFLHIILVITCEDSILQRLPCLQASIIIRIRQFPRIVPLNDTCCRIGIISRIILV